MTIRIEIDRELCGGHGRCAELLGDIFELDADGFSTVRREPRADELAELERVARLCPELAISIHQEQDR